jgi:hypothetical protein
MPNDSRRKQLSKTLGDAQGFSDVFSASTLYTFSLLPFPDFPHYRLRVVIYPALAQSSKKLMRPDVSFHHHRQFLTREGHTETHLAVTQTYLGWGLIRRLTKAIAWFINHSSVFCGILCPADKIKATKKEAQGYEDKRNF